MKFSEEQIRDILKINDHITDQINKHKEEIELLEKTLNILNLILKQSSFAKASTLSSNDEQKETIPITNGTNGEVIAKAFVTSDQVSIVLNEGIQLDADTPPFKSFFLERIIGEMRRKDSAKQKNDGIQNESMIDYVINKEGSNLREIIVKNYHQKDRVNEIISTAGWSLTRMIENSKK